MAEEPSTRESSNTILVVDDDRATRRTLERILVDAGYAVETAADGPSALDRLLAGGVEVCLLDLGLPGMSGMEILRKLRDEESRLESSPAVIVISARDDMKTTVQAVQLGAYDYLVKPPDANRLRITVTRALEQRQTSLALAHLVAEEREDHGVGNIIGKSESIRDVYKKIGAVSTSRATVLITGESGTGKELVARAIHFSSETAQYPFVAVNCTAFPHHLLESELFGHIRGAFTGAVADKIGRFQLAAQGTLFLDEIGELPIDLQAKLLRVLQERVFERVGDTRPTKLLARMIAATHRDLGQMVKEGTFREDLYYRLKIVEVHLPPLRERREDIPLLVDHLFRRITRETHRRVRYVSAEAMQLLSTYQWPGNVRELENALTRGVVLTQGEVLTVDTLPISMDDEDSADAGANGHSDPASGAKGAPQSSAHGEQQLATLREVERLHIFRVLNHTHWNKRRTCAILQITRPTLDRKIREFGFERPSPGSAAGSS
ncbi:MAG: sigma-54-dependent Fis family transcriptional regulator [Deltaproteobacteria bacterium]|nr:sigma-54-dependent Fis family transcriptional regulator [Deltaproteobacteria bacterium]